MARSNKVVLGRACDGGRSLPWSVVRGWWLACATEYRALGPPDTVVAQARTSIICSRHGPRATALFSERSLLNEEIARAMESAAIDCNPVAYSTGREIHGDTPKKASP